MSIIQFPGNSKASSKPYRPTKRGWEVSPCAYYAAIGLCIEQGKIAEAQKLLNHVAGQWSDPLRIDDEVRELYDELSREIVPNLIMG